MHRRVEPELLDQLPPEDPGAIGSRKDLQRLNAWLRHPSIMAAALRSAFDLQSAQGVVDMGAGDGAFMLRVARKLAPDWKGSCVTLLDRQNIVPQETLAAFKAMDWHVLPLKTD